MSRVFRRSLYFAIGLLLGVWSVSSHADTYNGSWNFSISGVTTSDPVVALSNYCALYAAGNVATTVNYIGQLTVQTVCTGGQSVQLTGSPFCPQGGSITGYSGSGASFLPVCTKTCSAGENFLSDGTCSPTCPAGQEMDSGVCKTQCPSGYHRMTPDVLGQCAKDCIGNQFQDSQGACRCLPTSKGIYSFQKGDVGAYGCDGGCAVRNLGGSPAVCPIFTTSCYAYGGRNGMVCTPASPPVVDITLAPLPPPAPVPPPVVPTPENPTPPPPDPKTTPDNNKDPVACGAAGGTYLTVNGQGKCATAGPDNGMEKVKAKFADTVTTNPDGTKTITTEKIVESIDPKTGQTTTNKTSTTTTKDAAGNTTGTGTSESTGKAPTGTGSGSSGGGGEGEGDSKGQCAKEPNSPMCRTGIVPVTGQFSDSQSGKVDAAKSELRAKFAEVKAAAASLFAGNLSTGVGSLPCFAPIVVFGKSIAFCFTQYSDQLSIVGLFVMLTAALGAAFIVLRR